MELVMTEEEIKELVFKALNPDTASKLEMKVKKMPHFKLDYVKLLHDVSEKVEAICNKDSQFQACLKVLSVPVCDYKDLMVKHSSGFTNESLNDEVIIIN